ncbi:MAG: phosphoethanolamine--lipid A transferase [Campylobacterales bacterium]|nr:phosphoethanolamine--lipid A transferase [Campylobacterales bacterium]
MKKITSLQAIFAVSLFLVIANNLSFWHNVSEAYPLNFQNIGFLLSIFFVFITLLVFLFHFTSTRYTLKPMLIVVLIASSLSSYFMLTYNVVIDDIMIQNIVETNVNEASDLFSYKVLLYFLFLGVLPSFILYKSTIEHKPWKKELVSKVKVTTGAFTIVFALMFAFSDFYASFLRENKSLRFYSNLTYYIYSLGKYIGLNASKGEVAAEQLGLDAAINKEGDRKKVLILVVGETARADHFSLNGYAQETNPELKLKNVINFSNIYSCGTSTAVSVPCMFSRLGRNDYNDAKAASTENVLDVLKHAGVKVLWQDNNSDSKGVALRVEYEDYKHIGNEEFCDNGECRDEAMLIGLQDFIEKTENNNILIVLHQMGNHGPAYYKRYPKEFEKFLPVCKTNQLQECTDEEINNAYDNALLYTDYFLAKTIDFLKSNSETMDTAMIYVSDHGESLGENGVYLHGLPYFIAPQVQKHVPAVMWFSEGFDINTIALRAKKDKEFSHDNLFDSLLGLFKVSTDAYEKELDLFWAE